VWTAEGRIEKEPDLRSSRRLSMVFSKMNELGSVRQVCCGSGVRDGGADDPPGSAWRSNDLGSGSLQRAAENTEQSIYGGAYAFGKTKTRIRVIEGRARKTMGHKKPRSEWTVLISEHHPGYIPGAVRTQPSHDRRQRTHEVGQKPRRGEEACAAKRLAALPAMRANAVCFL